MKILLLTTCMMSFAFYQQNNTLLSKKADKDAANTQQVQPSVSKDSRLHAAQRDQTGKPRSVNTIPGKLHQPAKPSSGEPKN